MTTGFAVTSYDAGNCLITKDVGRHQDAVSDALPFGEVSVFYALRHMLRDTTQSGHSMPDGRNMSEGPGA